jgi:hypothetical protein
MKGKRFISSAAVALAIIYLVAISAHSQNTYCVGPSATGNGSGSDWANLKAFSGMFTARGDTWYLVGGSYPGATFGQQTSGTLTNTILKATASNYLNVTPTGWTSTMATQAQFSGMIAFQSGYWVFDGQTRNTNDWFDSTGYGFLINGQSIPNQVWVAMGQSSTQCEYIRVSYVDAEGLTDQSWTGSQPAAFYCDNGNNSVIHNRGIEFSYCHVNNGNNGMKMAGTQNCMVQYNAIENLWGSSTWHGDVINLYYCDYGGGTVRYNKLRNTFVAGGGTGGVTCYYTGYVQGDTYIYGNTFYNCSGGDGCVAEYNPSGPNNNIHVYNNTMVDSYTGGVEVSAQGGGGWVGNDAYNNLIVGVTGGVRMWCNTDDYNGWSGSGISEPHGQYNIPYSIFVNYANQDFRLARNTVAGTPLSAPYNVDMLGNIRTSWSRGAYEFIAVTPPMLAVSAPLLAFGSVRTNTTRDLTLTVQNRAGGTLAGTATAGVPFSIISGSAYSLAAGQSQSVTVRYSPVTAGSNWQTIWFTGGGGATVTASGAGGQ